MIDRSHELQTHNSWVSVPLDNWCQCVSSLECKRIFLDFFAKRERKRSWITGLQFSVLCFPEAFLLVCVFGLQLRCPGLFCRGEQWMTRVQVSSGPEHRVCSLECNWVVLDFFANRDTRNCKPKMFRYLFPCSSAYLMCFFQLSCHGLFCKEREILNDWTNTFRSVFHWRTFRVCAKEEQAYNCQVLCFLCVTRTLLQI